MNAAFTDTFYWIAFTNVQVLAHVRVKALTRSQKPDVIITTEEVLIEYLNYFAGWGSHFRSNVVVNTQSILGNHAVRGIAQTAESFQSGFDLCRARCRGTRSFATPTGIL